MHTCTHCDHLECTVNLSFYILVPTIQKRLCVCQEECHSATHYCTPQQVSVLSSSSIVSLHYQRSTQHPDMPPSRGNVRVDNYNSVMVIAADTNVEKVLWTV